MGFRVHEERLARAWKRMTPPGTPTTFPKTAAEMDDEQREEKKRQSPKFAQKRRTT